MSVVPVDSDNVPEREPDESGVAQWTALLGGTTRERLIERLAQAHLSRDADASDEP